MTYDVWMDEGYQSHRDGMDTDRIREDEAQMGAGRLM